MKPYKKVNKGMRTFVMTALVLSLTLATAPLEADDKVDSLAQKVDETTQKIDGITEQLSTVSGDVTGLKAVKLSGYLQARYEANDSSLDGVAKTGDWTSNGNANNFYIRRGRMKVTYQAHSSSKYVFYIDASKQSLSLKEAYVELKKSAGRGSVSLTVGQFNYPFGYEIEYSSSKRDFPERSLAENKLFKGERDRGINLTWTLPKTAKFNLGLFQGWGIEGSEGKSPTWYDPTAAKDVIARAKFGFGKVDVGFSGYWGKYYDAGKAATSGSSSWYDSNNNGQVDSSEVTTKAPTAAVAPTEKDKTRLGIDAQYYLDVLPMGGTAFKGELYVAKDFNNSTKDSTANERGWYLWVSQTIGKKFGAAIRYDYWDPETDNNYKSAKTDDATGTLSLAANYFWDANVKITAAYDVPRLLEERSVFSKSATDVKDNRFTLQFQYTL